MTLTPEFALARLQSLFQTYAGMKQLLDSGDPIAVELWNRTVRNSGEPQAEKFLVNEQQAAQASQAAMQKAMQQAQLQSLVKAKAAGQETLAKESAKAVVKHLSLQAEMALTGGDRAEAAVAPPPPGQAPAGQLQ